jgi:hypothetical protein
VPRNRLLEGRSNARSRSAAGDKRVSTRQQRGFPRIIFVAAPEFSRWLLTPNKSEASRGARLQVHILPK